MNKQEFLATLKAELSFISFEEREDAIKYYEEYFEDAGENKEEAILLELGSPKEVAAKILDDLGYTKDGARKSGSIELKLVETLEDIEKIEEVKTENNKTAEDNIAAAETVKQEESHKQETPEYNTPQKQYNQSNNRLLILILLILSCPIWLPVFFSICAVIISLFFTFLSVSISLFGVAISGAAIAITGIGLLAYGAVMLFTSLFVAITSIGYGFLCLGAGMIVGYIFFRAAIFIFKWQFKITAKLFSVVVSTVAGLFSPRKNYRTAA